MAIGKTNEGYLDHKVGNEKRCWIDIRGLQRGRVHPPYHDLTMATLARVLSSLTCTCDEFSLCLLGTSWLPTTCTCLHTVASHANIVYNCGHHWTRLRDGVSLLCAMINVPPPTVRGVLSDNILVVVPFPRAMCGAMRRCGQASRMRIRAQKGFGLICL